MLVHLALLALATVPTPGTRYPVPGVDRPRVELWTDRGDAAVYTRGERVRVFFRLDRDAFVTIFRVDTDGRVRVLFPREPWEDNFARGGREFEVETQSSRDAFTIDDYPGVGYVFAVTAADPFVYDGIETGDHWDYRAIADGRVRGDPYVALTELAERIVPAGYVDWDYDIVSYNVGQHYDYPRFLCYDCHSYVSYPYWDPYYYSCVRFRIVVFDDPYYYPYRYYGGTRVVVVRPYRPQPRFIFKDWGVNRPSRDGFVTRERERPANDNTRRGVTGRDLGGIGIIPPPTVRDRRDRPGDQGQPDRPGNDGNHGRNNDQSNDRNNGRHDDRNEPNRPNNDGNRDNRGGGRRQGGQDQQGRPAQDQGRPDRPMILPPREEPRRVEPRQVEPRNEPRREEPRRVEPRNEPRRDEPRRVEPRSEPRREEPRRAEPQRAEPQRTQPRADAPRAEPPRREAPKEKPRTEPEVRRRKP
ncbi:MAG TPA: DUF4384 domain-containing protein [Gemmatimonadales bacterium]|nr:DUF4384 domain-containing protein [Gemmatimonadales bacterium]